MDNTTDVGESMKRGKINLKTPKAIKKKATKGIKIKFTFNKNNQSEDINNIDNGKKKIRPYIRKSISDDDITTDKVQEEISNTTIDKQNEKMNPPPLRRKRKLYSPKDEECHEICVNDEEVATDIATELKLYGTKKSNNYYKQLEEERKEYIKKLRNRKLETKQMAMTPKTKHLNDAFNHLKNGIEDNEIVILADRNYSKDIAIYNFTSDSEDDDFKKETVKRRSNAKAKDEQKTKKVPKRKSIRSNTRTKINRLSDNLGDERMRDATVDVLNTSLHQTSHEFKMMEEPPLVVIEHTMEPIEEITLIKENIKRNKIKRKHIKTEKTLSRKKKVETNVVLNDTMDRIESPLPELLVEATVPENNITNDTLTENIMLKFKDIYERKSIYDSERDSTCNVLQIESSNFSKVLNVADNCNNISKDYIKTFIPSTSKIKYTPIQKQKGKSKKSTETVNDEIENSNRSARSKYRKDKSGINEEHHIEEHNSKTKSGRSKLSDLTNLEEVAFNKYRIAKIRSPVVSATRLSSDDINKWLSPTEISDRIEIDRKEQSDIKRNTNRPKGKNDGKEKKQDMWKTANLSSSISPIKLFEDLKFSNRRDSVSSKYSNTERGKREGNLFYTNRISSPITSVRNTQIDCREGKSRFKNSLEASRSFASCINLTTVHREEDIESQRMDCDPSTSSVNDWFNKTPPATNQAEDISDSFEHHMSSIMEKLDTTLVVIHHGTSKGLAEMFARTRAKLGELRRQRRLLNQRSAADLLNSVSRLMDQHFAELDRRSQERDEHFMTEFEDEARKLIREDCIKKKALLRLLREDTQAVIDFINKGKDTKIP